jgi:hypothetical protein
MARVGHVHGMAGRTLLRSLEAPAHGPVLTFFPPKPSHPSSVSNSLQGVRRVRSVPLAGKPQSRGPASPHGSLLFSTEQCFHVTALLLLRTLGGGRGGAK